MQPVEEERSWFYKARRSVEFFGEDAVFRVVGAGGLVRTTSVEDLEPVPEWARGWVPPVLVPTFPFSFTLA